MPDLIKALGIVAIIVIVIAAVYYQQTAYTRKQRRRAKQIVTSGQPLSIMDYRFLFPIRCPRCDGRKVYDHETRRYGLKHGEPYVEITKWVECFECGQEGAKTPRSESISFAELNKQPEAYIHTCSERLIQSPYLSVNESQMLPEQLPM